MKKIFSFILTIFMLVGVSGSALANDEIMPLSSLYIDAYGVALSAEGNGEMCVSMSVDGVGVQDKIGVVYVDIYEKRNGQWYAYDTLYATDHPEFYDYVSRDYMGDAYFEGTPGRSYYVTMKAYAGSDGGSDTRYISSEVVVCE